MFAVSDDIIVNGPSITTSGTTNTATHNRGIVSAFDSTKESWTENVPCVVVLRKRGIASSNRNINNNDNNGGDVKKIKKKMDKYETSDEGEEDEDASNSSLGDDDNKSDGYASMSTFDVSLHDGYSDGKDDEEDHDNHDDDDNNGEDLLDVVLSSAESGESNDDYNNSEERIKTSKNLINAQASSALSSSLLPNRPLLRYLHSDQVSSTRYNIIDSPSETETVTSGYSTTPEVTSTNFFASNCSAGESYSGGGGDSTLSPKIGLSMDDFTNNGSSSINNNGKSFQQQAFFPNNNNNNNSSSSSSS